MSYLEKVQETINLGKKSLKDGRVDIKYLVQYLQYCLAAKDGYIMGSYGQDPKKWGTTSWWYTQYSGSQKTKALYWREHCERVHDCQGMSEGYLTKVFGETINVRARNNYASWCSPKTAVSGPRAIPTQYRVPGAAVFKDNGRYIHHVGYLEKPVNASKPEGDWYVIEAKGVMYGVVRTKLYSSSSWNKVGLMTKYFYYDNVDVDVDPLSPDDPDFGSRILKKGCEGNDVKLLQETLIDLGFSCGKYGADGEFGSCTKSAVEAYQTSKSLKVDGIVGEKTFEALKLDLSADPVSTNPKTKDVIKITSGKSVYVRDTDQKILGVAHIGDEFDYISGKEYISGFYTILYNQMEACITKKYTEKFTVEVK